MKRPPVCYVEETDSTNTLAFAMAEAGLVHGGMVVADRQTAGRGRNGRKWNSPDKGGLYASMLLRLTVGGGSPATLVPLVAASCMADALVDCAACLRANPLPCDPMIKWPNDILLNGRKIGGVLCEARLSAGADDSGLLMVVGIGVNLSMPQCQLPARPIYPASSVLAEYGFAPDRDALATQWRDRMLAALEAWTAGDAESLRLAWQRRDALLNRRMSVRAPDGTHSGIASGIDTDGALLLRTPNGTERIVAGDCMPDV